jgi:hypothetical protein
LNVQNRSTLCKQEMLKTTFLERYCLTVQVLDWAVVTSTSQGRGQIGTNGVTDKWCQLIFLSFAVGRAAVP